MALPEFSMRQLLEAGVHFGHQTHRWDPKMKSYIFGDRNGIHIIDLSQTVPLLHQALVKVRDVVAGGGRVLFVGTKRQAHAPVAEAAQRCAQYYMNVRWLGGTLTNWETISGSIKRLKYMEETLNDGGAGLTKKERLQMTREQEKLEASLGGIRDMGGVPDLMFVVDVKKEAIAIQEAKKLGIPVVAIVDTNCSPANVDHIIPGNDDAARAIALYCNLVADAVIDGLSASQASLGIDIGEMEETPAEILPEPAATEEVAAEAPVEATEPAIAPAAEAEPEQKTDA
ncbi:30S ribosomal protein S2 [Parvularcula sp. IMCC14364]|uniref:30S ribosomal protein S2 n=1 Tax=Parvularcula sp. IMCC14364 TaxID=3067902 RepID=UPI003557B966